MIWDWTDYLMASILAVLFAGVVAGTAWIGYQIPWHNLTCKTGHYSTVHVKAHTENLMVPIVESKGTSFMLLPQWIPDHDEQVWVCDEKKGSQ